MIIPIPKGEKDKSKQDNYRGITLMSTMRKIFEKGMLDKISSWVKNGDVIDDLHGASQVKCSSIDTNWLLRETVANYQETGSHVYICTLDVKKAFDTLWQEGLFVKLYNAGIDHKVWNLLRKLNNEFQCCVKVCDMQSRWFKALQGIIQGGPFSMLSYELFNNGLLQTLRKSNHGCIIDDQCCS